MSWGRRLEERRRERRERLAVPPAPVPVLHLLRVPEGRADVLVSALALHHVGALACEESPRDAAVSHRSEVDHEVRRGLDEVAGRVDAGGDQKATVQRGVRLCVRPRDDRTDEVIRLALARDALKERRQRGWDRDGANALISLRRRDRLRAPLPRALDAHFARDKVEVLHP